MKTIYLLTSNHNNHTPYEILKTYKSVFYDNGYKILTSNKIVKNNVNLILDEFTSKDFRDYIVHIKKKYPKTIIGCFTSEMIDPILGIIKSFQHYKDEHKFISLIKIPLYFIRIKFADLIIFRLKAFLKKNSILFLILKFFSKNIIYPLKIHKLFDYNYYFFFRYLTLMQMKKYTDFYISWAIEVHNENLLLNKNSFLLLPNVNFIKKNKEKGITISGSVTNYRKAVTSKVLSFLKIRNNFLDFLQTDKKNNHFLMKNVFYQYSLNLPQNKKWANSSPIKYLFSIFNHEIPLVIGKFKVRSNAVPDLCIYKSFKEITNKNFFNYNVYLKNLKIINKKIEKYKDHQKINNNFFYFLDNKIRNLNL
jgi:hypothetical protein